MSQAAVERTLGKLLADDSFRKRFFANPAAASFDVGLDPCRSGLDALTHLSKRMVAAFGRRLDDRICRSPLEAAERRGTGSGWVAACGCRRRRRSERRGASLGGHAEDAEVASALGIMQKRMAMKTLLVVLAFGVLVGAAFGVAQAQGPATPAGNGDAYQGSAGPAVSRAPRLLWLPRGQWLGTQPASRWIRRSSFRLQQCAEHQRLDSHVPVNGARSPAPGGSPVRGCQSVTNPNDTRRGMRLLSSRLSSAPWRKAPAGSADRAQSFVRAVARRAPMANAFSQSCGNTSLRRLAFPLASNRVAIMAV